jgi:hypothetical protein
MATRKLHLSKNPVIAIVHLDEQQHSVALSYVDFSKGPSRGPERVLTFPSPSEAQACMQGAIQALVMAGWVEEEPGGRERPAPAIPEDFTARFALRRFLAAGQHTTFTGRASRHTLVPVPLAFGPPDEAVAQIRAHDHLRDWLRRNRWPEKMVPFAWLAPVSKRDEELWTEASPSETEQFFAVDQEDRHCPVYTWTPDAGFERIADSLEVFLEELAQR